MEKGKESRRWSIKNIYICLIFSLFLSNTYYHLIENYRDGYGDGKLQGQSQSDHLRAKIQRILILP